MGVYSSKFKDQIIDRTRDVIICNSLYGEKVALIQIRVHLVHSIRR